MDVASRWVFGVLLSLANCFLSSIGFVMQRKSHLLEQEEPSKQHGCRPLWICGVILYIAAALPDVVAYALVPQVVCSCVACFRLVVVTILAHFVLHEKVNFNEVLGMGFCSLGTVLCLLFGPRGTGDLPVSSDDFFHAQVETYIGIAGAILLVLLVVEHMDDLLRTTKSGGHHNITLPVATGLAYGLEKVFNTEIGFMKAPRNMLASPRYTCTAGAIVLLGVLDFYLNLRGAKKMPVQVFVPIVFALSTVIQYAQSVFIFNEFALMSRSDAIFSMAGATMSLAGAICIKPPKLDLLAGATSAEPSEGKQPNAAELAELGPLL
eukprot:TRINITY_DN70635_c0_g1_i1.p1 TRINITY_DN70635_c0_g1~~TRINITY_DN70635_c0_g1_i1.p1  ORF type:complete len:322 (-),score=19.30 TRINITY_DN70635_c0_g1_i1:53-1018(-)